VTTLRAIGYWLGPHAPDWPAVEQFVELDADTVRRATVAAALDRGRRTDRAYMGFSTCRLCGCANGSGERTNGVFVWPEGLSHYVRDHHVRLPNGVESALLADEGEVEEILNWAESADDSCRDYDWWRSLAV
jgi:hypothetical protein